MNHVFYLSFKSIGRLAAPVKLQLRKAMTDLVGERGRGVNRKILRGRRIFCESVMT